MNYLKILVLILASSGSSAWGQSQKIHDYFISDAFESFCQETVTSTRSSGMPNTYFVSRPNFDWGADYVFSSILNTSTLQYEVRRTSLDAPHPSMVLYSSKLKIVDLKIVGDQLWILLPDRIDLINFSGEFRASIELPSSSSDHKYDRAYDMDKVGNYIVVANGTKGLAFININSEFLEFEKDLGLNQVSGHKSLAVSITSNEQDIYVGVSGLTVSTNSENAFNGLVRINLKQGGLIDRFPISRSRAGVLTLVTKMKISEGVLFLNNWGTLQSLRLNLLRSGRQFELAWIQTLFSESGSHFHAEALGEFYFEHGQFISCAKITQVKTTKRTKKKGATIELLVF